MEGFIKIYDLRSHTREPAPTPLFTHDALCKTLVTKCLKEYVIKDSN